jgi:hypothetical protein
MTQPVSKSVIVASLVLTCGVWRVSTVQQPVTPQMNGLSLIRYVNTVQNEMFNTYSRYVTLEEVLAHPGLTTVKPKAVSTGVGLIRYEHYQLQMSLSSDGTKYLVSAVPLATCGQAWFSDQRGLIYTGKVLGCSDQ